MKKTGQQRQHNMAAQRDVQKQINNKSQKKLLKELTQSILRHVDILRLLRYCLIF